MTRFGARLLLPICLLAGCAPPDTRSSRSETMLDTAETQSALFDTCAWMGWYGDGECDEYCLEPDPDCAYCADGVEFPGYVDYDGFCSR